MRKQECLATEAEGEGFRGGGSGQPYQKLLNGQGRLEKCPLDLVKKVEQVVIKMLTGWETKEKSRKGFT